jgi:UDP-N-acetylmuramate--alanine ligase
VVTFGLNGDAEIRGSNLHYNQNHTVFDVMDKNQNLGEFHIHVPGEHNVKNALGALTLALQLDISVEKIRAGLDQYNGVRRRFDIKYILDNGIIIIDDYAHHPSEVASTIQAAKSGWGRRLISVFQPHLYTRTRDFYKEFAQAFQKSDVLIVTDIYQAREMPIPGITAEIISDTANKIGHKHVEYIPDQTQIAARISEIAKSNDIIITMGAGNIWRQCERIYEALCN